MAPLLLHQTIAIVWSYSHCSCRSSAGYKVFEVNNLKVEPQAVPPTDQPNQNAGLSHLAFASNTLSPVVAPCLGVIAILIVFAVQREASAPGWFRADFSTRTHHTTSLLTSTTNLVRQHLPHAGVQLMLPAVLCAHACVFATTQKCVLDGGARTPLQTLRDNKHYGHSQGGK